MKKLIIAAIAGFIIGIFSGLIGVGGGEFRLPILIGIFNLPIHFAAATNLIIGLLISGTSFWRRMTLMTPNAYHIALWMGIASIVGGYLGAHVASRAKERILSYILIAFLLVMGLKLILSPFIDLHVPNLVVAANTKLLLIVISGFLIGIISGIFGVAGGEFRIPILMFLLALPIKLAGTVSSLVALFAQVGGLWKHHRLQHIPQSNFILAIIMGATSVIGSYIGATLVFRIDEKLLESLLGIALILATIGLYRKLKD